MSLDNNMWVIAKPGIFEEGRALNSATAQWSHVKNSIQKLLGKNIKNISNVVY